MGILTIMDTLGTVDAARPAPKKAPFKIFGLAIADTLDTAVDITVNTMVIEDVVLSTR